MQQLAAVVAALAICAHLLVVQVTAAYPNYFAAMMTCEPRFTTVSTPKTVFFNQIADCCTYNSVTIGSRVSANCTAKVTKCPENAAFNSNNGWNYTSCDIWQVMCKGNGSPAILYANGYQPNKWYVHKECDSTGFEAVAVVINYKRNNPPCNGQDCIPLSIGSTPATVDGKPASRI